MLTSRPELPSAASVQQTIQSGSLRSWPTKQADVRAQTSSARRNKNDVKLKCGVKGECDIGAGGGQPRSRGSRGLPRLPSGR
eukprot:1396705-Pyramimonas_sp.AAC.1